MRATTIAKVLSLLCLVTLLPSCGDSETKLKVSNGFNLEFENKSGGGASGGGGGSSSPASGPVTIQNDTGAPATVQYTNEKGEIKEETIPDGETKKIRVKCDTAIRLVAPASQAESQDKGSQTGDSAAVFDGFAVARPGPSEWHGAVLSAMGSTLTAKRYRIAAGSPGEALSLLAVGTNSPEVEDRSRVVLTSFGPSAAQLDLAFAPEELVSFDVVADGVKVASSSSGIGGAQLVRGADGLVHADVVFPLGARRSVHEIVLEKQDPQGAVSVDRLRLVH